MKLIYKIYRKREREREDAHEVCTPYRELEKVSRMAVVSQRAVLFFVVVERYFEITIMGRILGGFTRALNSQLDEHVAMVTFSSHTYA